MLKIQTWNNFCIYLLDDKSLFCTYVNRDIFVNRCAWFESSDMHRKMHWLQCNLAAIILYDVKSLAQKKGNMQRDWDLSTQIEMNYLTEILNNMCELDAQARKNF